jgi:cytochrome c oxidase subunit 1
MVLAFMYHLAGSRSGDREGSTDRLGFALYLVGGLTFVLAFLAAGQASVPRRFAVHLPAWLPYDRVGSVGAVLVIVTMLVFAGRIVAGLVQAPRHAAPAHAAD